MALAGSSTTSTAASVGGAPWECVKFDKSWARSAISCSDVAVPEIMLAIDTSRNTTVLPALLDTPYCTCYRTARENTRCSMLRHLCTSTTGEDGREEEREKR